MVLSLSTDYYACTGSPEPYLRQIAEAGFAYIHWCHHWSTDFLYAPAEIEQIRRWLSQFGLRLLDAHGSCGQEKNWLSPVDYEREAGLDLARNRIDLTAALGGDALVMHMPRPDGLDRLRRALDVLEPYARAHGVRIALENGSFPMIADVLDQYAPDYLGFCYDSGHENIGGVNAADRARVASRLLVTHLDDNNGKGDDHMIPFAGTADWPGIAGFLAGSAYDKCLQMEVTMHGSGIADQKEFLARAYSAGERLSAMVAERRLR